MDIISPADLASWLRDSTLATDASLIQIVDLTNELVTEEWKDAVDPAPTKIRLLALGVAARAWTNNPAQANLESVTRTIDDASRTERYRSAANGGTVYLTDGELATLHGKRKPGSVRLIALSERRYR